jgi:hypothetical protein
MRTSSQDRSATSKPHQTAGHSGSDLQLLRRQQLTNLIPDATLVEIMLQWQLEEKKRHQGSLNRADKKASKDSYAGSTAKEWTVYREEDNGRRFVVMAALTHEEASALVSGLEARGHKHLYWLQRNGSN